MMTMMTKRKRRVLKRDSRTSSVRPLAVALLAPALILLSLSSCAGSPDAATAEPVATTGAAVHETAWLQPALVIEHPDFSVLDGVCVGPDGNIYVADKGTHALFVFDDRGRFLRRFGELGSGDGQLHEPTGIAFDRAGHLVVVDQGNGRVQLFDSGGRFVRSFGIKGSGPGEFIEPQGIAVDGEGRILITDATSNRVQVFDSEGRFLHGFGMPGTGDGEFDEPESIVVDARGRILVADEGNHRVQVFDAAGKFLFSFGGTGEGAGQFIKDVEGLVVDGDGLIYALDERGGEIEIFDGEGRFRGSFGGGPGVEPGQFNSPDGMTLNEDLGVLLVADQGNRRVQLFRLDDIRRAVGRAATAG